MIKLTKGELLYLAYRAETYACPNCGGYHLATPTEDNVIEQTIGGKSVNLAFLRCEDCHYISLYDLRYI